MRLKNILTYYKQYDNILTKGGGAIGIYSDVDSVGNLLLFIETERNGYGKDTYKLASKTEV